MSERRKGPLPTGRARHGPSEDASSKAKSEAESSENPLAALDVRPLSGPRRVGYHLGDSTQLQSPPARSRPVDAPGRPRFVIERDEHHVQAYRAEAGPSVLRSLRERTFAPQDELDLHGWRARDVEAALAAAVKERALRGITRLLVIHGKGLHSEGGVSVLSEAVFEALTEGQASSWVRGLCTAPRRLGGSGALLVSLTRRT